MLSLSSYNKVIVVTVHFTGRSVRCVSKRELLPLLSQRRYIFWIALEAARRKDRAMRKIRCLLHVSILVGILMLTSAFAVPTPTHTFHQHSLLQALTDSGTEEVPCDNKNLNVRVIDTWGNIYCYIYTGSIGINLTVNTLDAGSYNVTYYYSCWVILTCSGTANSGNIANLKGVDVFELDLS
jgi:hypothetical protein